MKSNFAAAVVTGLTMAATMFSTSGATAYAVQHRLPSFETVTQTAAIVPLSMQYFCASHRSECAGGGAGQVTMSPNLMAVLKQINSRVNRAIRPEADTADVWELNPTSGDCEDYVLSKRSALV